MQYIVFITEPRNLVVFYCKHSFHEDCLPNFEVVVCILILSNLNIFQFLYVLILFFRKIALYVIPKKIHLLTDNDTGKF